MKYDKTTLDIFISEEAKDKAKMMANRYFDGNISHYLTHLLLCNIKEDEESEEFFSIMENARNLQREYERPICNHKKEAQ